jgi:thymidylate kinase
VEAGSGGDVVTGRVLPWVNIEGVNGVGKTYLAQLAAQQLGRQCLPLVELPDTPAAQLPGQVIGALRSAGDLFLRTGNPRTETLLLAALQVHRWESLGQVSPGQVVLEDRGPHSVAVYQAAVLADAAGVSDPQAMTTAWHILSTISYWRPEPTATVVVLDEPGRCLHRFEQRLGRPASESERVLVARVDRIYRLLVAAEPGRYHVIDRQGANEEHAIGRITDICRRVAAAASAKGAPCPRGT